MTEPSMNPKQNREKMAEIHFEKFGFDRIQVGIQALLPLFAEVLQYITIRVYKLPYCLMLVMVLRIAFLS
jgi:actin-related protein